MLSLCLPTYRYDVRPLVAELLRQAAQLADPVEILVYDDGSPDDDDWGRMALRTTPGIRYVELEINHGRAAIRNKMARAATHDYLVMMDADGWPDGDYLAAYLDVIREHDASGNTRPLVCNGGRYYAAAVPTDPDLRLHWWYGFERESLTAAERRTNGWLAFHSNNFLVSRQLLLTHPFAETHAGYGHEDTLWGQQFAGQDVTLRQLENPVLHLGLEPQAVFLKKQREAVHNLVLLHQSAPHLRTRLIDLAERQPWLRHAVRLLPEKTLVNYLLNRARPSLYALDLLKLKWYFRHR